MRIKSLTPFIRRGALVAISALNIVACNGSASPAPTAKKDETTSTVDDTPDTPASLSGSYLTDHMACAIPKLKLGDKYVQACCVLQDKKNVKVKVKGLPNDTFKVAPPAQKDIVGPQIEAINLTSYDKQLCHVVYRAPIVGGMPSSALGLTAGAKLDAKATIKGFLNSIPLFKKAVTPTAKAAKAASKTVSLPGSLTENVGKKAMGLALTGTVVNKLSTFGQISLLSPGLNESVARLAPTGKVIGTEDTGVFDSEPMVNITAISVKAPAADSSLPASDYGGASVATVDQFSGPTTITAPEAPASPETLGEVMSSEPGPVVDGSSIVPGNDINEFTKEEEALGPKTEAEIPFDAPPAVPQE